MVGRILKSFCFVIVNNKKGLMNKNRSFVSMINGFFLQCFFKIFISQVEVFKEFIQNNNLGVRGWIVQNKVNILKRGL